MIEQVVVALAALGLAAWIAKPLLDRRGPRAAAPSPAAGELAADKEAIYRSILDLELDHEMGKIDERDFERLRRQSRAEALAIIRQLADTAESAEMTLEEEISAARARLRRR